MRRRPLVRGLLAVTLAVIAVVGVLGTPVAIQEVRAAAPDLTIVGAARYTVQPDQRRVRVSVTLTLTNHLTDTKTTRYFFDRAFLAVMPQASAFRLHWAGSGTPTVQATKRTKDYTVLRLGLAGRLFSGKTATYTLGFDIVDPGGKALRDIRIGDSLVSFPTWAFASDSTPGGSVTVVFPKGYRVDVAAGHLPSPTTDAQGRIVFRSGTLADPISYYAFLVADRPGAYTATTIKPMVGGSSVAITVSGWPEDPAWRKRVRGLVAKGAPVLGNAIGLAWPRTKPLVVREAVSRSTGGYAGLFDPTQGLVEIAYYATDFVVLHETAHTWFNGALLADRWANEAFASYYALDAAKTLKIKATGDLLTPALEKARIPLNAWGAIGRESTKTEDYAYAATLALAQAIADRAGPAGLRAVWSDAAAHIGAYQPPAATGVATPELVAGPPDWRGLLDLLEARTGATYDDLWRTWVARDSDLPLLDARQTARARYDAVVTAGGAWRLPASIRDAMRDWRFSDATTQLDAVSAVLTQRDQVEAAARAAGLTTSGAMEAAFENDDDLTDAAAIATAESAAIADYQRAVASEPAGAGPIAAFGLLGETPMADLATAAAAFTTGDLTASTAAADRAAAVWTSAASLGQGRVISVLLLLLALALSLGLVLGWRRGRRRRRNRMQAHLLKR
jgi:hypothetical protein